MTPSLDLLIERLKQITQQLEALEVALDRVSRKGKQSQHMEAVRRSTDSK